MADALLPVLIVGPIVAAVVSLVGGLRWPRSGWAIATITSLGVLPATLTVAWHVRVGGRLTHELAGFPREHGIELVADALTVGVLVVIAAVVAGTLVFARVAGPRGNAFYAG